MTVSVVIPAYNRAHRLGDAIASVHRQGISSIEIIVVDDGSTDGTREHVARHHPEVRYVHQRNAGAGAARNTGIRHATGDLVAFLDSDDRWPDFKLSIVLALFTARPDLGLVFSDFVIEKPGGRTEPHGAAQWAGRTLDFPEMPPLSLRRPAGAGGAGWPADMVACHVGPMYRQLLDELPILTSSAVVRRAVLDDTTWFAEHVVLFEDWEFFARLAKKGPVGYIDLPAAINVGHGDPGRVSKCSNLDRASSYQSLLERNWLADPAFASRWGTELRQAYGRALLAVAREALLAGERQTAAQAMTAWRVAGAAGPSGFAAVLSVCASLPAGGRALKLLLRGRTALRMLAGRPARPHATVNPAA